MLRALERGGLKVNPKKAQIGRDTVLYLGQEISQGTRTMPHERRVAIQVMPRPVSLRGVRKVLGLFNYSRTFIPNFATLAEPIQWVVKGGEARGAN